jgi:hypothetical protein
LFSAGGCLNIYLPRGWECVWRYRIIIYSSVWWETMTKWRQMRQVQSETFKFLFFLVSYFFKRVEFQFKCPSEFFLKSLPCSPLSSLATYRVRSPKKYEPVYFSFFINYNFKKLRIIVINCF